MKHFNYIKIIALVFCTFEIIFSKNSTAQCFEIESILVDACGNPESENEMVRFVVGNNPLNTNDLSVSWATSFNPCLGVCQNASTAQTTAQLNNTITTCGNLIEPTNGILPAGAKVIIATSTNLNASFNSFDGLNETIYIIYQCNGNTAGHFGNNGGSKTVSMSFSGPNGCTDEVTYNASLLETETGSTTGSSSEQDGATVNFTPNNTASYINYGCQAPITPNSIQVSAFPTSICPLDTVNLNAISTNSNVVWKGGNGTFSNQNNVNTVYYSDASDVFPLTIYAGFPIPCGDTLFDSTEITLSTNANIFVTPTATALCAGETITLQASGASSFTWNDGSTGSSLIIDTAGTFFATTNQCGIDTASVEILWNGTVPVVSLSGTTDICQGQTTQITATGDGPFTWHNNSIGSIYEANASEDIYASVSNSCGSDTAFLSVNIIGTPPSASITGNLTVCGADSANLIANGGDDYLWSDGSTNNSLVTDTNGYVIASNICGLDTAYYTLTSTGNLPNASINGDPNICNNEVSLFSANGGERYEWFNGNSSAYYTTDTAQNIFVVAFNACGSDTAYLNLIDQSVSANFEMSDSVGYQPLPVEFTNTSINAIQYSWHFGNGNSSSTENEEQTYSVEGKFMVELLAANGFCIDTAYKEITILNNTNVFIPNSFSPNGDFINDLFSPILSNIQEDDYSFSIFDRNGTVIFNTESLGDSWNGSHVNNVVPTGVYIWKLKYKVEGKLDSFEKMGHVNVIR